MIGFIKLLCTISSLILLIITVCLLRNLNKKLKHCKITEGVIDGFCENTSELKLDSYEGKSISPIIKYSINGKDLELIGNYYCTSMRVGDSVKILYDKNTAKGVVLKGLYLGPIITGMLSLMFMITVLVLTIKNVALNIH